MATKSKFDALLAPAPEKPESEPAELRSKGEALPAPAAASVQYGKRRDSRYTQISALIPADLKRRFKAKVALEGEEISTRLEELIASYVDDA